MTSRTMPGCSGRATRQTGTPLFSTRIPIALIGIGTIVMPRRQLWRAGPAL